MNDRILKTSARLVRGSLLPMLIEYIKPDKCSLSQPTTPLSVPLPNVGFAEHVTSVDAPADVVPENNEGLLQSSVPAIDWNAGSSPLDAWLNQSALPSSDTSFHTVCEEENRRYAMRDQEQRDLKHLRRVHVILGEKTIHGDRWEGVDDKLFEKPVWPHFRKILDKFPTIPVFLAKRLANSNFRRDERLRKARDGMQAVEKERKPMAPQMVKEKEKRQVEDSVLFVEGYEIAMAVAGAKMQKPKEEKDDYQTRMAIAPDRPNSKQQHQREQQDRLREEQPPETIFYRSQGRRSSSVCSYRSSRNNSLRGDEGFDATYQMPSFSRRRSGSGSSYDSDKVSPSLPPPPTRESDQEETWCDACGTMVKLRRRRDWQ